MKKIFALLLVTMMLQGCSLFSSHPKPQPVKNPGPQVSTLTYPGAPGKIAVSSEFRAAGTSQTVLKNGNETSYLYFTENAGRIEKLVIVRHYFLHDTSGLTDNLFDGVPDIIEKRSVTQPSGPYQYALYRIDGLLKHEQEYLAANGLGIPDRFLAQALARKTPPERSALADLTYIVYLEDISKTDNGFAERAGRAVTVE